MPAVLSFPACRAFRQGFPYLRIALPLVLVVVLSGQALALTTEYLYVDSAPGTAPNAPQGASSYTTVQAAIDQIPTNLVAIDTAYVVEVVDSATYVETVVINPRTTDATRRITLTVSSGQAPILQGASPTSAALYFACGYTVVENLSVQGGSSGIYAYNSLGWTIRNCHAQGADVAGISATGTSDGGSIEGCRIFENENGIWLTVASGVTIKQTAVFWNDNWGIYINGEDNTGQNLTFTNNTLYFNQEGGEVFYNQGAGPNCSFKNNIVYSTGGKPCVRFSGAIPASFTSDYNLFFTSSANNLAQIGETFYADLAAWQTAVAPDRDTHSIERSPRFVAPAPPSPDLRLIATSEMTSPAVNAADPANGQAPNGTLFDIGAYGGTADDRAVVGPVPTDDPRTIQVAKTIHSTPGSGDYTTISAAIAALPASLIKANESLTLTVLDSATYTGGLTITIGSDSTHTLTLQAAPATRRAAPGATAHGAHRSPERVDRRTCRGVGGGDGHDGQ